MLRVMTCPSCGEANAATAKFCGECGSPLLASCPACGVPRVPGAKFCTDCGTPMGRLPDPTATAVPLATPDRSIGPGREAERRLVTVLFAALVGFPRLSESRDSEEVRELLTRYFDVCRTLVARHGGVVEKFI